MADLPVVRGDEAIAAFQRIGYEWRRQTASHAILRSRVTGQMLSIPSGHKELATGTLRALIRQAKITVDQFVEAAKQ